MKKILLIAISAAALSAYALPTYEPFTEYASQIASNPTNLVVTYANGTPVGTNANAAITNCLDLVTGGYTAPGGELWGILNFSGTASGNNPPASYHGLDIAVVTNNTVFTSGNLSGLFPSGFPGIPVSGGIAPIMENPAQPLLWYTNAAKFSVTNIVGNSAVLKFAQDITRPTSGTKTLFVSYLFNLAQAGQLGNGNNGRYLAFVASTNLVEGTNLGPTVVAYTNWTAMFSTFTGNSATGVHYASHGLLSDNGTTYYIGACDSYPTGGSGNPGRNWTSSPLTGPYGSPIFVVGEYVLNSGANADTNIVWVNPSTGNFGGATPPTSGNHVWPMTFNMSDLGGLVFIDRVGNGAQGGVGTNYIANLLIGSTWSYVTGGPEFTNQPPAITSVPLGGNTSLSGAATAAGQSVGYQWYKIQGGQTNAITTSAGGTATVTGANTATLSLNGVSVGDTGDFLLLATASGTAYTLYSTTANLRLPDPKITANPANATANYGQSASFTATATTASAPLAYQWYLGTTPLNNGPQADGSGAYGARGTTGAGTSFTFTLLLTNVSYQEIGSYTLYVTNTAGFNNGAAPAALAVNDPIIITQPANPAVVVGGNATFTVVAAGSPSPSTTNYQWYDGIAPGGTQLSDGGTPVGGTATVSGSQTPTLTLSVVSDADNGSYYCQITGSGSGQTTNSAAATLTVQDPLTILTPPSSLTERVCDHLAFFVVVGGGGPQYQWYAPNSSPIAGATSSALVLTNITMGSNGTYSVTVQNLATTPQTLDATLTVINSNVLNLSSANLVVARVGDGAQTLSGATGNTLYLDQYTPGGSYVSSIQVPDEAIGSAYPTGGASSLAGSPALLVQGAGGDAANEAMLTLSGINQEYLGFAGYCQQYPYTGGSDVTTANLNTGWRGLATINAFGAYSLAYTNYGLFSGGNHTICSMVTLDGTNFWTTGQAGAGTVKFVNSTVASYANGIGIPSSSGKGVSAGGGRVIEIVNGPGGVSNLVYSETGATNNNGLYVATAGGTPEPGANGSVPFKALLYTGSGTGNPAQPGDFAFSPDTNTLYIADSRPFDATLSPGYLSGGIQRWDANGLGGYSYSYTLAPLPGGATNGARGLTVDFSASANWGLGTNGAKIYATTYGAAGNNLVEIVDNGASSAPTVLATAGPNQALRGVRFGPAVVPPGFSSQLQNESALAGSAATFSADAVGSGPLTYQWYFQAGGTGPFVAILHATNATYTITVAGSGNVGNYYVVVKNPVGSTAQSQTASFTLATPPAPPQFIPPYPGLGGDFQLNFTGPAGLGYTIWATTNVALTPVTNTWTKLTTGSTFTGGTDTYTDPSGGTKPRQFYIITVP